MSYLLGIDLGTTYTAAAVQRMRGGEAAGEPEMLGLGTHGTDMPSVVLAGEDGSLLVGDAAERRAMAEPDRVAREFKRRIGDPTPVSLGAGALPAQDLAAVLVRHVVETAAAREGGLPERIALTHPASWGAHKLDLLRDAVATALSGVSVELLAEPQAAAVCYAAAERVGPGSTIAVYDLGGGTFDAAVVRKDPAGGFTLLGRPEGVEFLGGVDFDEVVFDHVRAGAPEVFDSLDESDPGVWAAVARLRRECREAKEALSADTEVSVPVFLGGARQVVRLHRGEFEELIGPRIEDTVEALRRAVDSAGLEPGQLSSVLLVGGSSRIPLVAQTVSEQLGRPVAVDTDPKNAIAKGAALALLPPRGDASWPGVRPPLPGAAGAAPGATAHGAAGAHGAEGRPPGVESSQPSTGVAPLADAPGPLPWESPGAEPPTHLIGPAGEPATAYLPGPGNTGTSIWAQDPPTDRLPPVDGGYGDGYDGATTLAPAPDEPSRSRSPALLIGAGAVVAAVAVVGALVFWPDDRTVSNATPALPAVPTATTAPPSATGAPTYDQNPETGERTTERRRDTADPQPPPVVPPAVPPARPTTAPPVTTTSAPPVTTTTPVPAP